MNSNPLQMPKRNDLKLALSHCKLQITDGNSILQFPDHKLQIAIAEFNLRFPGYSLLFPNCNLHIAVSRFLFSDFSFQISFQTEASIADYSFQILGCTLSFPDLSLQIKACSLKIADCRLQLQFAVCSLQLTVYLSRLKKLIFIIIKMQFRMMNCIWNLKQI